MDARVRLETTDDGVGWLRFKSGRPANAITRGTLQSLAERLVEVAESSLRVLVLAGAPGNFAGGADVDEMASLDADGFRGLIELEFDVFRAVEDLPIATVAALAGSCAGNGAELALTCDLRVAARSTTLSFPETRLGFTGPAGRLSRFVGLGQAKDILLTGRSLRAEEALPMGLYSAVVDDEHLEEQAARVAARLARVPVDAVRRTKVHIADVYGGNGLDEQAMVCGALEVLETPEVQAAMAELRAAPSDRQRTAADARR